MASTFADIVKRQEKAWGVSSIMESVDRSVGDKIPFSSPMMNWATYGGIPRNKMTEFFGEPGGGKSSTAVDICKHAVELFEQEFEDQIQELSQKVSSGNKAASVELDDLKDRGPKKVLYIDLEHAFDTKWCATLGLDRSDVEIMQPPDVPAEDILNMLDDIIQTDEFGLVVLDSIPSLVTKTELEKKLGEKTVSALAGLLTVWCRKVVSLLTRYSTTLLVINQIRDNMDNPYVVNTPGGKALKFYSSLRIFFRLGTPVDFLGQELPQKEENPAGHIINAKLVKQKTAPFDRKLGTYYLLAKSGIHPEFDFANLAIKKYGIIRKSGAWFTVYVPGSSDILEFEGKPIKLNGLAKVYDFLNNNLTYYNDLRKFIEDDINGDEKPLETTGDLI